MPILFQGNITIAASIMLKGWTNVPFIDYMDPQRSALVRLEVDQNFDIRWGWGRGQGRGGVLNLNAPKMDTWAERDTLLRDTWMRFSVRMALGKSRSHSAI